MHLFEQRAGFPIHNNTSNKYVLLVIVSITSRVDSRPVWPHSPNSSVCKIVHGDTGRLCEHVHRCDAARTESYRESETLLGIVRTSYAKSCFLHVALPRFPLTASEWPTGES